jgi:hypothetical protein
MYSASSANHCSSACEFRPNTVRAMSTSKPTCSQRTASETAHQGRLLPPRVSFRVRADSFSIQSRVRHRSRRSQHGREVLAQSIEVDDSSVLPIGPTRFGWNFSVIFYGIIQSNSLAFLGGIRQKQSHGGSFISFCDCRVERKRGTIGSAQRKIIVNNCK